MLDANDLHSLVSLFGGFSVDKDGASVSSGYAVSVYPEYELVINADVFTPESIAAYVDEHAESLDTDGHVLGAWHNKPEGKVYLDISIVVKDELDAIKLAQAFNQLAVYDLGKGETVYVDVDFSYVNERP